jgi:hypothetical protein
MGGQDHTVPEAITKSTLKQYRHSHAVNDLIEFPDRGHSLTIDHGRRDIAQACLDWLYKNSTPMAGDVAELGQWSFMCLGWVMRGAWLPAAG